MPAGGAAAALAGDRHARHADGELGDQQGVESVDVHRPNLEEIFVGYMQCNLGDNDRGAKPVSSLGEAV